MLPQVCSVLGCSVSRSLSLCTTCHSSNIHKLYTCLQADGKVAFVAVFVLGHIRQLSSFSSCTIYVVVIVVFMCVLSSVVVNSLGETDIYRVLSNLVNAMRNGNVQVVHISIPTIVQSIYRWTHHKLQQKVFLRIHYQKGLQNNIPCTKNRGKSRRANIIFSAKSKMAAKNVILSFIQ